MATFNVKVVVEFEYEVEADNEAEAEQAGWLWEDYKQFGVVDSIETDEVEEDEDEVGDFDDETDDEYALASAGHGNDEDY
jgi:hypothetical protein